MLSYVLDVFDIPTFLERRVYQQSWSTLDRLALRLLSPVLEGHGIRPRRPFYAFLRILNAGRARDRYGTPQLDRQNPKDRLISGQWIYNLDWPSMGNLCIYVCCLSTSSRDAEMSVSEYSPSIARTKTSPQIRAWDPDNCVPTV
ncbi:hypothetical protein ACRALDRAFT_206668 [Sodiomyces alcalophilus JCM 7366]|uniref:uncharacterized protein n=1 Tax=Sodiomyces alcalophilus JCM 7366 TaxID=591952 RepID=UPI0039B59268